MTTQDKRVRYAMSWPEESMASIGRHFGISRERIRQVFEQAGYRHPPFSSAVLRENRTCVQIGCSTQFLARPKERLGNCPDHRGQSIRRTPRVTITCAACGKRQERRVTLIRSPTGLSFCNNQCQGAWLGRRNRRT